MNIIEEVFIPISEDSYLKVIESGITLQNVCPLYNQIVMSKEEFSDEISKQIKKFIESLSFDKSQNNMILGHLDIFMAKRRFNERRTNKDI